MRCLVALVMALIVQVMGSVTQLNTYVIAYQDGQEMDVRSLIVVMELATSRKEEDIVMVQQVLQYVSVTGKMDGLGQTVTKSVRMEQ